MYGVMQKVLLFCINEHVDFEPGTNDCCFSFVCAILYSSGDEDEALVELKLSLEESEYGSSMKKLIGSQTPTEIASSIFDVDIIFELACLTYRLPEHINADISFSDESLISKIVS